MIDGVINNGPKQTVAELEEQAKSGKPISLMELAQAARREQAQAARQEKKPSVLAYAGRRFPGGNGAACRAAERPCVP